MGRPSTVSRLSENVCEVLHGRPNDPATIQEEAAQRTTALLDGVVPGHRRVSWRAVNRYDRKFREVTRRLRGSCEVASRMTAEPGSAPGGEMGRLLTETVRTVSFLITAVIRETDLGEEAVPGLLQQLKDLSPVSQPEGRRTPWLASRAPACSGRRAPRACGVTAAASGSAGSESLGTGWKARTASGLIFRSNSSASGMASPKLTSPAGHRRPSMRSQSGTGSSPTCLPGGRRRHEEPRSANCLAGHPHGLHAQFEGRWSSSISAARPCRPSSRRTRDAARPSRPDAVHRPDRALGGARCAANRGDRGTTVRAEPLAHSTHCGRH